MFCMVICLCKKFHFLGTITFKHGIVNNQYVSTVC